MANLLGCDRLVADHSSCLEAGMDGYLSKPVRAEQLPEMLGQYLSGSA